jgi:hypothetical protein
MLYRNQMSNQNTLSVGVYRDAVSPEIDTGIVSDGLALVGALASFKVLEEESIILPAEWGYDHLNVDSIGWPKLDGDINIVLTNRHLIKSEHIRADGTVRGGQKVNGGELIGFSYLQGQKKITRVAVVDAAHITRPDVVVAHETGHLLDISIPVNKQDHCPDKKCIMTSVIDEARCKWGFCSNCETEFTNKSANLLSSKARGFVLGGLFPNFRT